MRSLLHAPSPRKRSIAAATLGALALIGSLLVATPAQALNDGASAWSKTKYRGYQGYIRCNTNDTTRESYTFGPTITVNSCANYSPKGKDILYEQITIQYGIGGYAPRYGGSMHATIMKSGSQPAGEGVGF